MLPFLEEQGLASIYDFRQGWDHQPPHVIDRVIQVLVCPSASHDNPYSDRVLASLFGSKATFGVTDYVFSKGVFDGWCVFPRSVRKDERGMFDVSFLRGPTGFTARATEITDGLSKTIAMGEGASGPAWPVCQGPGCTQPVNGSQAMNGWATQPNFRDIAMSGFAMTSTFASTLDPINKNPVTQTIVWVSPGDVNDVLVCRCSVDWRGTGQATGKGQTSGFRSDHVAGAYFLFADGSVQFLKDSIELNLLRSLSTIQGSEN